MEAFYSQGVAAIIIVCLVVLLLANFRKKSNLILMIVQRGILGFVVIAVMNQLFASLAIELFVGVNVWTLLTSAILGIPGVCMLYCMNLFL